MERLGNDYEALHRAFAWYIRTTFKEFTGVDALTDETINMIIEDYVVAHGQKDKEEGR